MIEFQPVTGDGPALVQQINEVHRQMVSELQRLGGRNGRITLLAGLDLSGNSITGLSDPPADDEALTKSGADTLYGPEKMRQNFEIAGSKVLASYRQLSNPTQLENNSSFLNNIISTPANANSSGAVSVANNGDGTSTIVVPAGRVKMADGTFRYYAGRPGDIVSNPGAGSVFYYYYYGTVDALLHKIGPYTADSQFNRMDANTDGRVLAACAQVNAAGGGSGGGGGDGSLPPRPGDL